ncbi:hypothetical protein F5146DRAFT_1000468 [Armillaria mellea]|nr:hypothetical protein F5146DRAFT_1000468 [Armillaria mellea]
MSSFLSWPSCGFRPPGQTSILIDSDLHRLPRWGIKELVNGTVDPEASFDVKVEDIILTTPRKKPHCRICGMPMQSHRREPIYCTTICPSEDMAYASSVAATSLPTVKEEDVKPVVNRTPNARRRKSRAKSIPRPEIDSFPRKEYQRMPGTIAPDNEFMHAPPRMATWCQLGFAGFMGGASFFLLFYMVLAFFG